MAKSELKYNQKEVGELTKLLEEKERKILGAKMDYAQGKTKDAHVGLKLRREIAKIKTALRAKELMEPK